MSKLQNLDQRRAKHAWDSVEKAKALSEKEAQQFGREARKLSVRIMASGLGQALAFLIAKSQEKKPGLKTLVERLGDWVLKGRPIPGKKPDSLIESLIEGDSDFLRRATAEVLAYLQWLVRFAEAENLTKGEDNQPGEDD